MDSEQVESGVMDLLCFMTVSASELMNEPKIYGPMRLMEASQRLTKLAEDCDIRHELLAEVSQRIEALPLDALPESEKEFVGGMDDLIVLLASWVRDH